MRELGFWAYLVLKTRYSWGDNKAGGADAKQRNQERDRRGRDGRTGMDWGNRYQNSSFAVVQVLDEQNIHRPAPAVTSSHFNQIHGQRFVHNDTPTDNPDSLQRLLRAVRCCARGAMPWMPGHSSVRLFIRTELEAAEKRYRHSHRLPPSTLRHPKPVFSTVLVQLPSSLVSDTAESRPYHPETRRGQPASQPASRTPVPDRVKPLERKGPCHTLGGEKLRDLGDRVATMMMPVAPLPGDGSRIWGHGIVTHLRMALDRHLGET